MSTNVKEKKEIYETERENLRRFLIACEKDDLFYVKERFKERSSHSEEGSFGIFDFKDGHRAGAVHAAARGGAISTLQFLLELRPDLGDDKDKDGRTPLIMACFSPDGAKCVEYLLKHNVKALASVECEISGGITAGTRAIHYAAMHNDAASLKLLLELGNANSMAPSDAGPPLSWSAGHATNAECAKVLLGTGKVDVNAINPEDGMTALILACFQGNHQLVETLCEAGAKMTIFAKNMSAMAGCVLSGSKECIKILLKHGGREILNMRDPVDNLRAVEVAAHCENVDLVNFLAKENAEEINAKEMIAEYKKQEEARHAEEDRVLGMQEEFAVKCKEEGNALFLKGEYEQAVAKYAEGVSTNPNCQKQTKAMLYANESAALLKLKKFQESKQAAERAVQVDVGYLKGHFRLAQVCSVLGDHESAAKGYWDAKELETKPSEKQALFALFQKEINTAKMKLKGGAAQQ